MVRYQQRSRVKFIQFHPEINFDDFLILGYDTKVTRYDAVADMESWALSGPTTSHGLPEFSWDAFSDYPHAGLPDTFANQFFRMRGH